jgi:hypothetical protein
MPATGVDRLTAAVTAFAGVSDDAVELVEEHDGRLPVPAGSAEDGLDVAFRGAQPLI